MKGKVIDFKDLSYTREVVERKIPPFALMFFYFVLVLFGTLLVWSFLAKKEIVVKSSGIIQSETTQHEVPLVSSKVTEVYFNEGDQVNKGDLIIKLDDNGVSADIENYNATAENYRKQIEQSEKFIESVKENTNKFSLKIDDEISKYYDFEEYLEDYNAELEADKEKFKNLKIAELSSEMSQTEDTLGQYEAEISKKETELTNYEIRASISGTVHFVSAVQVGSSIQAGYEVVRVLSNENDVLHVQLIISNVERANVHVGQNIRFQVGALSPRDYGYATGEITKIESDSRVNQENGQSFYIATAVLDQTELDKNNKSEEIRVGMQVEARMIVKEQRYLFWAIEKLELWIFD